MKISYNWLCELATLTLNANELAQRLTMLGLAVESVERFGDDYILDLDLTSNRPDALSHLGIAREAALLCGTELKPLSLNIIESDETVDSVTSVNVLAPELCPRFTARVVRGVKVGPSPKWLVDRLESIGQRSVNNIADITNYVMFELGQPTHAFDLNLLHERRIIVRRANAGEQLTTLDGFTRELSPEMLVIADSDRAVALAGIMGGEETEINQHTTDVLIESAYFNPQSIRHTSRGLGLDTEASYRFSRGTDYEGQLRASMRVAQMIGELAGGQILKGAINIYPSVITRDIVSLRESRIERLTGLRVSIEKAATLLRGLEFDVEVNEAEKVLHAKPPSFRIDISREEDLVEEVARHTGYDLIETTLPGWSGEGKYRQGENRRGAIRRILTGLGFDEAYCFSFVNGDRDAIFRRGSRAAAIISNPIDVNEADMRGSLLTGLLQSLQHNFNQGRRDVKLFELGRIFTLTDSARPDEHEALGLILTGSIAAEDWRGNRAADYFDLQGAVEAVFDGVNISGFTIERAGVEYLHPGQSAVFVRDGQELARLGRLHPRVGALYKFRQPVFVAEIDFESLIALDSDEVRYSALPRLPSASRDVSALVPDSVMWGDIEKAIKGLQISEIVSLRVFDVFKGKDMPAGFHSLAFRVTYRSAGHTLTDEEVNEMHERVRQILERQFGAQLR